MKVSLENGPKYLAVTLFNRIPWEKLMHVHVPSISYLLLVLFITIIIWAASSGFVSSSIPSRQILTAHAQPLRGARDLAFCLKVPLDSLLVWASSEGSGETARIRRLAWTFAARIGDKYQIRLTRSILFTFSSKSINIGGGRGPTYDVATIFCTFPVFRSPQRISKPHYCPFLDLFFCLPLIIQWRDKNIALASKVKLMRTPILFTFHYACESWALTVKDPSSWNKIL